LEASLIEVLLAALLGFAARTVLTGPISEIRSTKAMAAIQSRLF
jgi:hypothetical protein